MNSDVPHFRSRAQERGSIVASSPPRGGLRSALPSWLALATVFFLACGGGGASEDMSPGDGSLPASPDDPSDAGTAHSDDSDAMTQDVASDAALDDGGPAPIAVPRPKETASFGWKTCLDTYECGSLRVPLDYDAPDGDTIKLALMRRPASGVREGALFLNPGGPGGSAVDFLSAYVTQFAHSPLLDRFDLIAVDPRGVGYGTALTCHSKLQQLSAIDPAPTSDAGWQAIDDLSAAFAAECGQAANANLLPFVGTPNVARDMDRVRDGLGEEKLNYLGFSYGSAIGAWYAQLFPQRVGRLVLDGAIDLGLSALDRALGQAKGFELALSHYFAWCQEIPTRCSWVQNGDAAQSFAALRATVVAQPIPAPLSDRPLGPGDFMVAVSTPLYGGTAGWRALSPALDDLMAGDASKLMGFVDDYFERNPDRSYPNLQEMYNAVACIDQLAPSVAEVRAAAARFSAEAPTFGLYSLTGLLVCSHWPVPGRDLPAPTGQGAAPFLVIGTVNDPATPYAWAQAFSMDMVSSVLLTAQLEGHTGYERGDDCIDNGVNAFLFDAIVPSDRCADAQPKGRVSEAVGLDSIWARRRR